MTPSATALAGFAGWQVLLTVVLASYRSSLVLSGNREANSFRSDGSDAPPVGQRLTRAHANCYENLPMFAALILAATLGGRTSLTDPLAMIVLYARIGQSVTHLASTSVPAIFVRFGFYLVQLAIFGYWAIRLLAG
ncbi:MAG: hypothetical protein QOD06_2716 [Candidatus Binatota bacterium]|jgi:uncharacterized MAPEG superfamily protein|nr:hypothetical protein [Candidatus Binatota bacterium]